ncbi:MAG TPA: hypothetical protein VG738_17480 [Chitinophagaceae bacterium]|nr:hypothetical protein [Chitinophagaceae bacterium]
MYTRVKLFAAVLFTLSVLPAFNKPKHVVNKQAEISTVIAKRAVDFLNSIGANSAISTRSETLEKTTQAINYTGIRWLRTGYEGDIPVQDLVTLHNNCGVKFSYGLLSGGTDIPRLLAGGRQLAASNCLLAFEGPNEPNNWGITYKGESGGKNVSWLPVARLQHDLYTSVKADDILKSYPVFSLSENGAETDNAGLQYLAIPGNAHCLMPAGTRFADYANCHNYITHPSWKGLHDNQTWIAASPGADTRVDGLYGNYGKTWGKKFAGYSDNALQNLPRVTTETGLTIGDGVTEEEHARLLVNMYLAQFARGWSYTAVYLLRDRSDEQGNQQFGFYTKDYKARKAAVYLHNLTTILADNAAIKNAGSLQYAIPAQPSTVHDLLLQKSNGSYALIVWGERLNGSDDVQIKFGNNQDQINVYDITKGVTPVQQLHNARQVTLVITNSAYIIEIK